VTIRPTRLVGSYLPRDAAFAKLEALVAGAQLVRAGLDT
jgi:hypothetical protein